jgi:hypothetical protein
MQAFSTQAEVKKIMHQDKAVLTVELATGEHP